MNTELTLSKLSLKETEIVDFCVDRLKLSNSKNTIIAELLKEYKGYSQEKLESYIRFAYLKLENKYKNEGIGSIVIDHIEKYEKIYEESIGEGNKYINSPDRDDKKFAREQFKLALQSNLRQETVLGAIGINSGASDFFKDEENEQEDVFDIPSVPIEDLVKIKNVLDKYTISRPQGIRERIDKTIDEEVLNDSNISTGIYKDIDEILAQRKSKVILKEPTAKVEQITTESITEIDKLINEEDKPKGTSLFDMINGNVF